MTACALLIMFAGLWLSTQRFAASVGYDSRWCGRPWKVREFGGKRIYIYRPYMYFVWCLRYLSRTRIHPYLGAAGAPLKYGAVTGIAVIMIYFFIRALTGRQENTYGTARWATRKDIKELFGGKGGIVLGEADDAEVSYTYDSVKETYKLTLRKPSDILVQSGVVNVFLAAPTRSGKGVSCVVPTQLNYPGSLVVLDFKGENFNLTSGFRSRFGPVYRYAPVGDGHHFNPMMEIRPGKDAYGDANLIADILTTPASGDSGGGNAEHFRTGAKELLTGAILHCLCGDDKSEKSLPGVVKFLAQSDPDGKDPKYIYKKMRDAKHCDPEIHEKIAIIAEHQISRPEEEQGSMMSNVTNALSVFVDSRIKENHRDSDFCIEDFEKAEHPVTLYMSIPYDALERIQPLIRMFIIFMTRKFSGGETQATERKLKIPILFLLDEFDKLGKYDELEKGAGIFAGYGIHFFFICQSISQVVKLYTKDQSLLEHCYNIISYAPGNFGHESAKVISEIIGKDSVSLDGASFSGSGLTNMSVSAQEHERSLITPDEVMKLPGDQMLLFTTGKPPYMGKKVVYYMDKRFKERLLPPAFKTREEALKRHRRPVSESHWYDIAPDVYNDIAGEEDADGYEGAAAIAPQLKFGRSAEDRAVKTAGAGGEESGREKAGAEEAAAAYSEEMETEAASGSCGETDADRAYGEALFDG